MPFSGNLSNKGHASQHKGNAFNFLCSLHMIPFYLWYSFHQSIPVSSPCLVEITELMNNKRISSSNDQWTSLACTFCFPISDHVMPSREFSFCFFISYAYICTCIRQHLKETIPSSSITWSEMGKQNIQANEVYY